MGSWGVVEQISQLPGGEQAAVVRDLAGYASYLTKEQKLWLLETPDVVQRLDKLVSWKRSIARILRKVTTRLALGRGELPVHIGPDNVQGYVGRPKHTPESAERTAVPGVATGLAVTGAGGDVLFVEASLADKETGSTDVTLTGQLGERDEGIRPDRALSYLRSHGAELELPVGDLAERGVHVHVPASAAPKDGSPRPWLSNRPPPPQRPPDGTSIGAPRWRVARWRPVRVLRWGSRRGWGRPGRPGGWRRRPSAGR